MRIGEVAAATGVSTRALRYYEEQGLLQARRSPAGQRIYAPDAVDRVHWIQDLYAAGLSSAAVARMLPCTVAGPVPANVLTELHAHRAHVDEQLRALAATRDHLDALIASAATHRRGQTCRAPRSRGRGA